MITSIFSTSGNNDMQHRERKKEGKQNSFDFFFKKNKMILEENLCFPRGKPTWREKKKKKEKGCYHQEVV